MREVRLGTLPAGLHGARRFVLPYSCAAFVNGAAGKDLGCERMGIVVRTVRYMYVM